jgi:methylthioribose-1-phosphate isomerase
MQMSGTLEAIKYEKGKLQVLDQLQLPFITHYDNIETCEDAFSSIKSMKVRGAPAIAIVAITALAVELHQGKSSKCETGTSPQPASGGVLPTTPNTPRRKNPRRSHHLHR